MLRPLSALSSTLAVLLFCACGSGTPAAVASPDDGALRSDLSQGRTNVEVTFDAVVITEPVDSGGHERFRVSAGDQTLEIDHNNSLAPEVPTHPGDHLVIRGRLYIDPGSRAGVHCTHAHTSSGCPEAGFIRLGDRVYQ